MQVSVENTGALERRMEISVPSDRIEKVVEERLKNVGRTARLKGFRPGKAPIKVIRQQFGAQVRQEVLNDLMQSSFAEAVSKEKLQPATGPRIEPISMGPGQDLKYRAVFEILPEIKLQDIEGLAVHRPVAEVTEADIEAMVQNLREQRPKFAEVERASKEGDRVTMDFTGKIDGEAFEGSEGKDVGVLLGAGRMLADFETGITGVKAGEQKQLDVRYPDEYHNKALAGRTATFDVQVKKVEEKLLPEVDEEFCREYGILEGGVEQMRREIAENMQRELEQNVRSRLKNQLLDGLLAANPIDVPNSLVDQRVRELQVETGRRMGAKDISQLPPAETFVEPARRQVALGILIAELIRNADIKLDRKRVEERIADVAGGYPDPDTVVKAYHQDRNAMRQVENLVLEEQAVDYLLERAKVTDQASTFKEIMNFGA
jgi:trigger factor